jgi:hypothetical protein
MSPRIRRRLWDVVTFVALVGIAYGLWQMVDAWGWGRALVIGTLMCAAGWLSMVVVYPLWFRD